MLATKTILGAGWTVSARLSGRLIDIVTLLVLARALSPADFGLVAITAPLVMALDMILEVPLILALTSLPCVKKAHLDTAFTLGVLRGIVLALILFAAAWPIAHLYQDDRLPALLAAQAIAPIARSTVSPAMVRYIRDMSFRQNFLAELGGRFIAAVAAIVVVFLGGGYWAIVVNNSLSNFATTVISYILAPYRPAFSLSKFSEFSSFLGWFSTTQILRAFSWQFDRILLGYNISRSDLGQYTTASDLAALPIQSLIAPAMHPLTAAFARVGDDRARLRGAYLKSTFLTMMIAVPASIGMSLTSDLVVKLLLGAKWTEAAGYLYWLSFAVALNVLYQPLGAVALATRRTKFIFKLSAIETFGKVILMSAGLYFYSLMGVLYAGLAMSLIMFVVTMISARSLLGATLPSQIGNLWQVATACVAMTVSVLVVRHGLQGRDLGVFVELGIIAFSGAAIYGGTLFLLGVRPKDFLSGFNAKD